MLQISNKAFDFNSECDRTWEIRMVIASQTIIILSAELTNTNVFAFNTLAWLF